MKLLWSLLVASYLLGSSAADYLRHLQNNNQTVATFPAVYTAIIPAPAKESRPLGDEIYFAAEIDFLEIVETGLPSPYDRSGDDFIRISFMVHDQDELDYLNKLVEISPRSNLAAHTPSRASGMGKDESLTEQLYKQINYKEEEGERRLQQYSTIPGYSCYKNVAGSFDWMDNLVDRSSSIPNLSITKEIIGESYKKSVNEGGYDIFAIKVTGDGVAAKGRTTEKGIVFLMTGIHARELAPPELISRWIENLVDDYGTDAEVTAILDHTEIHIVLQANPDGRNAVENDLRSLRRKNLNPGTGFTFCSQDDSGVDLNRNFPFRWGLNNGSSSNKCAQTYRGQSPGSEPEVQAIVNYCRSIFPESQRKRNPEQQINEPYKEDAMGVFFDIHSYGEIIIWPWGHQNRETENDSGLETLVNKFRHFNEYGFSGPNNGFLYPASGATDDWAYGTLGAAGMTFELGNSFYQDCNYFENRIIPDNFPALNYAAKSSKAPYSIPKGPDVIITKIAVNGNSVTVESVASDNAFAATSLPTSQQSVSNIRYFVDFHPYDRQDGAGQSGTVFTGRSVTIDISDLVAGRHSVYFQAEDDDGYVGPVTAGFFVKQETDTPPVTAPTNAPTRSSTNAPTRGSTNAPISTPPVTAPTNAPTRGPTNAPTRGSTNAPIREPTRGPTNPPTRDPINPPTRGPIGRPTTSTPIECSDSSSDLFRVDLIDMNKGCSWLAENVGANARFDFLCELFEVAFACPNTCDKCEIFSTPDTEPQPTPTQATTPAPTQATIPIPTPAPTNLFCLFFPDRPACQRRGD